MSATTAMHDTSRYCYSLLPSFLKRGILSGLGVLSLGKPCRKGSVNDTYTSLTSAAYMEKCPAFEMHFLLQQVPNGKFFKIVIVPVHKGIIGIQCSIIQPLSKARGLRYQKWSFKKETFLPCESHSHKGLICAVVVVVIVSRPNMSSEQTLYYRDKNIGNIGC